jgi:hypothetical protein
MKYSALPDQETVVREPIEHFPEQAVLPGLNLRQHKPANPCQFTPKLKTLMQQIASYRNKNRHQ